ncbi:MAG: hypothetical protein CMJ46_08375 [Planctomyces sp.]|nr:hypothetical protein [Planctomyces sp.]
MVVINLPPRRKPQKFTPLSQRLGTAVADNGLLYVVLNGTTMYFFHQAGPFGGRDDTPEAAAASTYYSFYVITGWWLYFAFLERSPLQGSIFKRVNGSIVTDLHGNRIGLLRSTLRHAARVLTAMTLFLGYLTILFTKRRQALHDLLSGTMVIQLAPAAEDELIEQDYEDSPEPVT